MSDATVSVLRREHVLAPQFNDGSVASKRGDADQVLEASEGLGVDATPVNRTIYLREQVGVHAVYAYVRDSSAQFGRVVIGDRLLVLLDPLPQLRQLGHGRVAPRVLWLVVTRTLFQWLNLKQ